jgi:hypothetical protein
MTSGITQMARIRSNCLGPKAGGALADAPSALGSGELTNGSFLRRGSPLDDLR